MRFCSGSDVPEFKSSRRIRSTNRSRFVKYELNSVPFSGQWQSKTKSRFKRRGNFEWHIQQCAGEQFWRWLFVAYETVSVLVFKETFSPMDGWTKLPRNRRPVCETYSWQQDPYFWTLCPLSKGYLYQADWKFLINPCDSQTNSSSILLLMDPNEILGQMFLCSHT